MREKYVRDTLRYHVTCMWFFTFQRFILKFNKTVQSPRVPDFAVLGPEA